MKSFDPKLLAIFETEQQEHLERIRALLAGGASGAPALEEMLRRAHTLKGAARAVGLRSTELLTHRLETVFARVQQGSLSLDAAVSETIERAVEAVEDVLASVLGNRAEPDIASVVQELENAGGSSAMASGRLPAPSAERPAQEPAQQPVPPVDERQIEVTRVSATSIDSLVRSSSQLMMEASRQTRMMQEFDALFRRLSDLEKKWPGLRRQCITRGRAVQGEADFEAVDECLDEVEQHLRSLAVQARAVNRLRQRSGPALAQLCGQVHHDASALRMTPAETVFESFRRMVRDLARDEGKDVDFRAEGLDVEADRLVLQALKDPVMHLLRNSIFHGIESPKDRLSAGKPRAGVVRLRLEARGDELCVTVDDDGRGIDLARIAEVALGQGMISEAVAASATRAELVRLILLPGFSTSTKLTDLAGRGVGLSVVQDQVARLQGEVKFPETDGPGLRIELSVPLSISTHQVVLIACRNHTFAIPARGIDSLHRVSTSDVESVEGGEAIRVGGQPVFMARLADLLELRERPGETEKHANGDGKAPAIPVVVLRSGEHRAAVVVDALLDEREAIVKDLGISTDGAGLSIGGVPLDDGSVAVVLNPPAIVERFRRAGRTVVVKVPEAAPKRPARILVVDDSITTRSLERSILEAHGYEVSVAVDGVEALAHLRTHAADLVIADLMMPRMDGFELLEHIKHDRHLARLPVIVVTSLEQAADQERIKELGADAYIIKRKFDQRELLNTVRQIL